MTEILLFVAGSIGLAHIMVDGKIFAWLRDWLGNPNRGWFLKKCHEMITCHQCAGLWAGLAVGLLVFRDITWWQWLATGFAGSFLSMFMAIYYNYLEAQTIIKLPAEEPSPPPK